VARQDGGVTTTGATAPLTGDDQLAQIYDQSFDNVFRWVRALGCPEADIEDVTQEVFLVVRRKLSSFNGDNLPAWLYQIASLMVRDHRRRAWFRRFFRGDHEETLQSIASSAPSQYELLDTQRKRQLVYEIVRDMNAKWRAAFVLFEIEGYSGEEIAELERIPVATVFTHLHRARKEFFALLAKRKEAA
jgi:RNA polymerase sigma-70 factor (ECF subfamily)